MMEATGKTDGACTIERAIFKAIVDVAEARACDDQVRASRCYLAALTLRDAYPMEAAAVFALIEQQNALLAPAQEAIAPTVGAGPSDGQ